MDPAREEAHLLAAQVCGALERSALVLPQAVRFFESRSGRLLSVDSANTPRNRQQITARVEVHFLA